MDVPTHASQFAPRVPIHVLTGFLGSGKSTLLNAVLSTPTLSASAVIVNEFGDVGIDHLLVETSDDMLIELAGGCVCCAVRGDLAVTIGELLERRANGTCAAFERIIVETTGLADPNPVLNLLVSDPLLAERTVAASVVTAVEAINGAATLARFDEARVQVALADHIVMTKTDLTTSAMARARARALNPSASMSTAIHGLLEAGVCVFRDETQRTYAPSAQHVHAHGAEIETFTLRRTEPVPGAAVALFVECLAEQLGAALLRVKGLVALEESAQRPGLLQGAQHVFHPLDFLPAWPPDMQHATELVFIVRGEARTWIEQLFDAIVWEVRDAAAGLRDAASTASGESVGPNRGSS